MLQLILDRVYKYVAALEEAILPLTFVYFAECIQQINCEVSFRF